MWSILHANNWKCARTLARAPKTHHKKITIYSKRLIKIEWEQHSKLKKAFNARQMTRALIVSVKFYYQDNLCVWNDLCSSYGRKLQHFREYWNLMNKNKKEFFNKELLWPQFFKNRQKKHISPKISILCEWIKNIA